MMSRRRDIRGSTYIELLCAMGIILIAAYTLLGVLGRSRQRARDANCLSNLHQIGFALSMYAGECGGRYPPTDDDLSPLCPRYLYQPDVFRCPIMPSPTRTMGPDRLGTNYQYQGGLMTDADPNVGLVSDDRARHHGGANVLYADFRVQFVTPDQLHGEPMGQVDRYTWADTGLRVPPPQQWTPEEARKAVGP
jgi:prepilin-type processing-associated H-X9-DG protein